MIFHIHPPNRFSKQPEHEPIVDECLGCERIMEIVRGGKKIKVCNACCPYPRMEWAGGFECSSFTKKEPLEDPERWYEK